MTLGHCLIKYILSQQIKRAENKTMLFTLTQNLSVTPKYQEKIKDPTPHGIANNHVIRTKRKNNENLAQSPRSQASCGKEEIR